MEQVHLQALNVESLGLEFIKFEPPFCVKSSFSDAKFLGSTHERLGFKVAIDILDLFSVVKEVFQYRLKNPHANIEKQFGEPVGKAYDRFLKFMASTSHHVLAEMNHKEKSWNDESEFNVFVAREILQPLSGGLCLINNDHKSAVEDSRKNHGGDKANMLLPQDHGWGGLGMGYGDGFYGEPDLLIVPEGKFETACTCTGTDYESEEEEEVEEVDKKKKKKREEEEGESSEPGDSSPGRETLTEGEKMVKINANVLDLSQCFAQAILFASIQCQRYKKLYSSPVIRIHPRGFDIIIYNCLYDLLLMTSVAWTNRSFVFLWIVLHYGIFPIQPLLEYKEYSCGYLTLVEMFDKKPKADAWFGVNKAQLHVDHPTLRKRDDKEFRVYLFST